MPPLARLYIKTSLTYLGIALLVGVLMACWPLLHDGAPAGALWPTYLHLFVLGWLTQLIFGVAYWLFPRYSRDQPYGRSWFAVVAYVLLNTGLALRAVSEPAVGWSSVTLWKWGMAASALLQWIAVVLFAAYIWSRVKTK